MKKYLLLILILFGITVSSNCMTTSCQKKCHDSNDLSLINKEGNPIQLVPELEFGFLAVTSHIIQLGSSGTLFDYVKEGGQNNLFDFFRSSIELKINNKHIVKFLYQPLNVITENILKRDIIVEGQLFTEGTPMLFRYGFTFYRFSYMYDFFKNSKDELAVGLSLQIRNATIIFRSIDGDIFREARDIGLVPIIKLRYTKEFKNGSFISTEWDGFYASSKYINGSEYDFTGSILDCSIKAGFELKNRVRPFINLRYIGGGAFGTSEKNEYYDDGFTKNWLSLFSLTLGVLML